MNIPALPLQTGEDEEGQTFEIIFSAKGWASPPTLHNTAAQGLDVRHLPSPSPCGRGEVFSLDIPFYRTPPALHPSQSRETRTRGGTARLAVEQLSSLSFRGGRGGRNRVAVDCANEGTDGSHAADCGSKSNSPPCHCKGRSDKEGATSSVEMKEKGWASPLAVRGESLDSL